MTDKAKFETVVKPVEVLSENGNVYYISKQKITQENESFTEHIVIKKLKRGKDGSQIGMPKQLFIGVGDIQKVLEVVQTVI